MAFYSKILWLFNLEKYEFPILSEPKLTYINETAERSNVLCNIAAVH